MDKQMRVAILGFGTVGNSVARILCEHPPKGIELSGIFNRGIDRKRVSWVPSSVLWTENFDEVLACQPDIVVELAGGLQPAGEWVRQSLAAGKSVVTANKKLIAYQGIELEKLARSKVSPPLRSGRRRRYPCHSWLAAWARRRLRDAHRGHPERHLQLHPEQDGGGRGVRRTY